MRRRTFRIPPSNILDRRFSREAETMIISQTQHGVTIEVIGTRAIGAEPETRSRETVSPVAFRSWESWLLAAAILISDEFVSVDESQITQQEIEAIGMVLNVAIPPEDDDESMEIWNLASAGVGKLKSSTTLVKSCASCEAVIAMHFDVCPMCGKTANVILTLDDVARADGWKALDGFGCFVRVEDGALHQAPADVGGDICADEFCEVTAPDPAFLIAVNAVLGTHFLISDFAGR